MGVDVIVIIHVLRVNLGGIVIECHHDSRVTLVVCIGLVVVHVILRSAHYSPSEGLYGRVGWSLGWCGGSIDGLLA